MNPGTTITCHEPYRWLNPGENCFVLKMQPELDRVILAQFNCRTRRKSATKNTNETTWSVTLHSVPINDFYSLVENKLLVVSRHQSTLPPMFWEAEGPNDQVALSRIHGSPSAIRAAEYRLNKISPILNSDPNILQSADIGKTTKQRARKLKMNPERALLWMVSYLMYGRQIAALASLQPTAGPRRAPAYAKKTGRPPDHGMQTGCVMDGGIERACQEGYRLYKGEAKPIYKIYEDTMQFVMKAKSRDDDYGGKEYYNDRGDKFPTLGQFTYAVNKKYNLEIRQINKHGRLLPRRTAAIYSGRFDEHLINAHQMGSCDGEYIHEFPNRFDEQSAQKFCTVRMVCGTTSMELGLGGASTDENGALYKSALFSAAIDKVRFAALFGFEIEAGDWPPIGLCEGYERDKGGGQWLPETLLSLEELAPSYQGQSKAKVEAAHSRFPRIDDSPHHFSTAHSPNELMIRAITTAMKRARYRYRDPVLRATLIAQGIEPTPRAHYNHLVSIGRTSAQMMHFDEAVRRFLDKITVKATPYGLSYKDMPYWSRKLHDSKEYEYAVRNSVPFTGYVMHGTTRQIWVETDKGLMQADLRLLSSAENLDLNMTLPELIELQRKSKQQDSLGRYQRPAINAWADDLFRQQTGSEPGNARMRSGRPKKK